MFRDPLYMQCLDETAKEYPVLAQVYKTVVDYYSEHHKEDKTKLAKDMRTLKALKFHVEWTDSKKRERISSPAL